MSDATSLTIAHDPSRAVIDVAGADAETFLQGLLTNDVRRAAPGAPVYAAMLTPQGKFLFDALLLRPAAERFLLDCAAESAAAFAARLSMYKLRAAVTVAVRPDLAVAVAWAQNGSQDQNGSRDQDGPPDDDAATAAFAVAAPEASGPDPRHPALGWRAVVADPAALTTPDSALAALEARRVALLIPSAGAELVSGETFPLEAGLERAQGVDFKKGCYVGQEVTARMKHKAVLKKALARVRIDGAAPAPRTEIAAGGKPAGVIGAAADGEALAVLRRDRLAAGPLEAGGAALTVLEIDGGDAAS